MVSDLTGEPSGGGEVTLIDRLLGDQQKLHTPVIQFSEQHDSGELRTDLYRHLIPFEKPGKGQQYAFQVELDKCTSCKACVAACHSLNGLEEKESWRDVGLLKGGDDAPGWQQTVTTACHHCLEPECMHGCPVNAYEKDNVTGIVRHLDDQCIGCEYCSLKCPYDVPKYSSRLGIVRKCDMCSQRLEVGEAPACAQACPTEAIKIITIDTSEARKGLSKGYGLITGAPLPNITLPTTVYKGRDVPETAVAADRENLKLAPSHLPLVLMLALTQAGVGALIASVRAESFLSVLSGIVLFFAGLSCSILHLGRPLGAWRFFLGLKKSWLSREILAFSLFAPIALVWAAMYSVQQLFPAEMVDESVLSFASNIKRPVELTLTVLGLVAVFTSVMIYHDTKRENWHWRRSIPAFFGTTVAFYGVLTDHPILVLIPLLTDLTLILPRWTTLEWSPSLHQAKLILTPLKKVFTIRVLLGFAAVALMFLNVPLAILGLLAAELLSRYIYFRAVHSPKMPGMP